MRLEESVAERKSCQQADFSDRKSREGLEAGSNIVEADLSEKQSSVRERGNIENQTLGEARDKIIRSTSEEDTAEILLEGA